jgi:hypothetical protein
MRTNRIVLTLYVDEEAAAASTTADLLRRLQHSVDHIVIEGSIAIPDTQRIGTMLVAVLGATDTMEFAHLLHDWLARNRSAALFIGTDRMVECRGLSTEQLRVLLAQSIENEHASR